MIINTSVLSELLTPLKTSINRLLWLLKWFSGISTSFERKLSFVLPSRYGTQSMEGMRKLRAKANARGGEITVEKLAYLI